MVRILAAVAITTATLSMVSSAAASQAYADPTGDGQGGPDVTSVSVGSVPGGLVAFQVTTNEAIAGNEAILILVDTDNNATTGYQGAEYAMYAGAPQPASCGCGAGTATLTEFEAWNGSALAVTQPPSFQVSMVAANELQVLIGLSDIGSPSSFRFAAVGVNVASQNTELDRSPDSGWYTYAPAADTTGGAATVSLAPPRAEASGLRAGKPFTIAAHIGSSTVGASVACVATIAGNAVRESGHVAAHTASCSGKLPATSVGKRLTGTMTVTVGGARASREFAFRILPGCGCD